MKTHAMQIKRCFYADIPMLAALNKQLIEDEGSDNTMNLAELETRMRSWLNEDYHAFFFKSSSKVLGYALVQISLSPMYLRQFFICREYRRKGYGRAAFNVLITHLSIDTFDIDVLLGNQAGVAFWHSLGFRDSSVSMRFEKTQEDK
ncbi:MAG: GNAT family N-acetyltransferase [Oscillospiraceae bacterium]|jgi:predicted acetyltransferase|nr:GNAT family N-acetyltransferase [Oscillospiraceae bacterium]